MKLNLFLFVALLSAPAVARSATGSWEDVAGLPSGEQVRIHTASQRYEGVLASVSDTEIAITPAGGASVGIPRSDVQRVYVRTKSHRVRNTIIGTAIGVAAGAVLYGTLGSWFRNEGRDDTGWMLAVPIGIGAGVSAALPTGTMRRIYDAHR
jgi:hypothetical protein